MPRLSIKNINWERSVFSLRSLLDCSQEDLARQIQMTTSSISKWERGECHPQLRTIRQLKSLSVSKGLKEDQWIIKEEAKGLRMVKESIKP